MEIFVFTGGPGTGRRQVFGFCAIAGRQCSLTIIAFSQRDSLRGTGPWSLHISLMPRSVELFLTPSPAWRSGPPDRQTDRQTDVHTHTAWPHHTEAQKCKVASLESCLLLLSAAFELASTVNSCVVWQRREHSSVKNLKMASPKRVWPRTSRVYLFIYLFGARHYRSMCSWLEVSRQE